MPRDTIDILRDLIAIDSVNPSLDAGHSGEGSVAEAVAADLGKWGWMSRFKRPRPNART